MSDGEDNKPDKIETQRVLVGFIDETIWIEFKGVELPKATNYEMDPKSPNYERFHVWTLYEVPGGYRVWDEFHAPRGTNRSLTDVLAPRQVVSKFPRLQCVLARYVDPRDLILNLDKGDTIPKSGRRR